MTSLPRPDIVTELVVAVFRLNGTLVETGNALVSAFGLTTAWWQVLGALSRSRVPMPVAHVARHMGLSRQSVQRSIDLLSEKGLVAFAPNPHHRRAKLVVLTTEGLAAVTSADARQQPLGRQLIEQVGQQRILAALGVLNEVEALLSTNLESGQDQPPEPAA